MSLNHLLVDQPQPEIARSAVILGEVHAGAILARSAIEAGKHLYCHPNTVRHRLRRIERHTGRSLQDPRSSAELFIALETLRRLPEPAGGYA